MARPAKRKISGAKGTDGDDTPATASGPSEGGGGSGKAAKSAKSAKSAKTTKIEARGGGGTGGRSGDAKAVKGSGRADKSREKVSSSKRVTSKGGGRPESSTRYTPPVPRAQKVSPMWVPVLMFALLGLGGAVIVLNYMGLLPGATSNWYLLVGLGLILAGIITATNFH